MTNLAFVFPGQGSQKVGMGADLYDAHDSVKQLFDKATAVLGKDMAKVCFEGPQETLTQTANAQPGIFLVSASLLELLREAGVAPSYVAGHSLGEITAYYASGAIDFEQALNIIKVRGEGMANSHPSDDSGMAAIMGRSPEEIQEHIAPFANGPVVIANLNCPGQIVISGKKGPLEDACAALKESGAKVIPLPVSGAFHSPLMQKGAQDLEQYVSTLSFKSAQVPVVLNRHAQPESDASALQENLHKQVVSSVQWIDTMSTLASQVDQVVEVGPGKVLTGLAKKCTPDLPVSTVSSLENLSTFIASLKEESHVG